MKMMKQIINQKHVNKPVINAAQIMRLKITNNTLMLIRKKQLLRCHMESKEIMTKQHEKVFYTMKVNNEKAIAVKICSK